MNTADAPFNRGARIWAKLQKKKRWNSNMNKDNDISELIEKAKESLDDAESLFDDG